MRISKHCTIVAAFMGLALLATDASAGVCQVTTFQFYGIKHCGDNSRGYGKGSDLGANKMLVANSTGIPGGSSQVAAEGIDSSGNLLSGCLANDTTEDGLEVGVVGGACNSAVKWELQVFF